MTLRSLNIWLWTGLLFSASAAHSSAAVPSAEQIQRDLAGPFHAVAAQPKRDHRGPLMKQLEPLLMQQAKFLVDGMSPLPDVPGGMTVRERKPGTGEGDIRPDAHTIAGLAILVRVAPDEAFKPDFTREQARKAAVDLIRGTVWTHGAGGVVSEKGKTWGNQWQSALWANMAGEGAWLLWDDLAPTERWLAARMICDEADRFIDLKPPAKIKIDTKAEENAWDSMVISLAYCMFPDHPHNKAWGETAKKWIISSYVRQSDLKRPEPLDGKPIGQWVDAANIYEDFTLENHTRVHPDYMTTTTMLSYQTPLFEWAGKKPPEGLRWNVEGIYASSKKMAFVDGSWIYPGGQDWHLHRNIDWNQYHAAAAVLYNDPQAAALYRVGLRTLEKMAARTPAGGIFLPEEFAVPVVQPMALEWQAEPYLLMASHGEGPEPMPEAELWKSLQGKHVFEDGKFALLRTPKGIATFSWGLQVMGMLVPMTEDLLLTPNPRSLVGTIDFPDVKKEQIKVLKVSLLDEPDVLGVTGVLSRGNGKAEQRFGFLALPDGRTVYCDSVSLTGADRPTAMNLATLGVLNDVRWALHNGTRTLAFEGGERAFAAAAAKTDAIGEWKSPWFNLDQLGIVCLDRSGQSRYDPKPTGAPGRLEQLLHLNSVEPGDVQAEANAAIGHGVFVLYPAQTPQETQQASKRCELLSKPGDPKIQIKLEDGMLVSIDLSHSTMTLDRSKSVAATEK